MVMAPIASKKFNWQPNKVGKGDDPLIFTPTYIQVEEAQTSIRMVMAPIASKKFNWQPDKVGKGDDPLIFTPTYILVEEAQTSIRYLRSKFADLPAFGLWADRTESDDELLEEIGRGWRGFATEQ